MGNPNHLLQWHNLVLNMQLRYYQSLQGQQHGLASFALNPSHAGIDIGQQFLHLSHSNTVQYLDYTVLLMIVQGYLYYCVGYSRVQERDSNQTQCSTDCCLTISGVCDVHCIEITMYQKEMSTAALAITCPHLGNSSHLSLWTSLTDEPPSFNKI